MRRRAATLLTVVAAGLPGAGAEPPAWAQSTDPQDEVVLGKPSGIRPLEAPAETVLVAAGTPLYTLPDRRSALIEVVGADAPRAVLERAAGWVLVRVHDQAGWAAVAAERTGAEIEAPPDLDYLAIRAEPLAPEPERLAHARAVLRGGRDGSTGPFTIYSDLQDDASIELVHALATQTPGAYAARYGVEAVDRDRFAIVVFTAESSYREFERGDRELVELRARGHAAGNIAAIYAEGRRPAEIGPILLHEMTHLLNQSAFRGSLPPWLEEGMAEDMSFVRIDAAGRLEPGRLGGVDRRYLELGADGSRNLITELWGAPATLSRLVAALRSDQLMPLPDLMALSRREMMQIEGRPLRYGQSAFLVRYLLDGAAPEERAGFHRFLRRAAEGDSARPEDLLALLGTDWDRLAQAWRRWLIARERRLGSGR